MNFSENSQIWVSISGVFVQIDAYESRIASLREKIDELNASVKENPLIEQNELLIEQLQEEIDLLQEQKSELEAAAGAASSLSPIEINFSLGSEELQKEIDEMIEAIDIFKLAVGLTWAIIKREASEIWYEISNEITSAWSSIWSDAEDDFNDFKTELSNGWQNIKTTCSLVFDEISTGWAEEKVEMAEAGNFAIDTAEGIVNGIIRGINWCAEKINDVFSFEIPEWIPKYGGQSFSANLGKVSEISLPRIPVPALASGAVLPPNKPFMAWVGDQKNGTNVEAPLSTIEDALRNVMAEQEYNFNITADGSLSALIRLLNLQINRENTRQTAF